MPFGWTFKSSGPITDTVTGYVPLRLDLGYRIQRHFYIGAAAQVATIIANGCSSGESCGIELLDVELGADIKATRALRIGPVLSSSIAKFRGAYDL